MDYRNQCIYRALKKSSYLDLTLWEITKHTQRRRRTNRAYMMAMTSRVLSPMCWRQTSVPLSCSMTSRIGTVSSSWHTSMQVMWPMSTFSRLFSSCLSLASWSVLYGNLNLCIQTACIQFLRDFFYLYFPILLVYATQAKLIC